MKLRILFVTICMMAIPFSVYSQSLDKGYLKQVENFFALVKENKYADAVDYLYTPNPWIKATADDVANIRSNLGNLASLLGKYIDNQQLTEEFIGDRYVHLDYVVNFDRQPFRFYFQFYKAKDKWLIINFGVKGDFEDWAADKAKNRYLYLDHK